MFHFTTQSIEEYVAITLLKKLGKTKDEREKNGCTTENARGITKSYATNSP